MYCTNCGEQIDSKAFCPHCGTRSTVQPVALATQAPAYAPQPVERIRQNLFAQNVTCPNCGYFGPMGIVSERTPIYANCFVLALLVLTMVGLVVVLLLAILGKLNRTHLLECPQCGAQFEISAR
jgi:predicted RNA-binding Zn-ribbon protein involved in translation (DUF1610 family)